MKGQILLSLFSHRHLSVQDRVRSGQASSDEYFELGAIMLRKKYFVLANKYLEQAISKWEGEEQELAQVRMWKYKPEQVMNQQ